MSLAIIGASGKIGGATLNALLEYNLMDKTKIVCLTSSKEGSPKWRELARKGVRVRHASFEDKLSMEQALQGCESLFLVSTPQIELDFNDAPHGQGREKHHFVAIDAARKSGVKHIYYTSLAFQRPSKAGVMVAHIRTEEYLEQLADIDYTIIREGLYNESWPLYLGYYDIGSGNNDDGDQKDNNKTNKKNDRDSRDTIMVAGDGKISWTSIPDLGLGNALILVAPKQQEYRGKTLYLSTNRNVKTLQETAQIVGDKRGRPLSLQVVPEQRHVDHYVEEKQTPVDAVRWWVSTYSALQDSECLITYDEDDSLDSLLKSKNVIAKSIEETIEEMLGA